MDIEKYKPQAGVIKDTVFGYLHDEAGWAVVKRTKDVSIDCKPSPCADHDGHLYRGQMEIKCPRDTVRRYIDPMTEGGQLRIRWDKDVRELNIIKHIDDNLYVLQTLTNSAMLGVISPREFVDLLIIDTFQSDTEEGFLTCGVSIDYPGMEPQPKYVRGWNHPCGNMCLSVPGKPDHTRVVNFVQPDIKGSLPKSMVDSALPGSMVGFFTNLRDILRKDGHLKS